MITSERRRLRERGAPFRRTPVSRTCIAVAVAVMAALSIFARPVQLRGQEAQARLLGLIEGEGPDAAAEWYRDLLERPDEADELGAGPDVLVAVGNRLLDEERGRALLAVGHLGISTYGDEPRLHFLHGEGHRLRGELRESIQAHQRALDVDEGYAPSAARLQEIWGGPEPRPLGDVIAEAAEADGYLASRNRFFDMRRDMDQTGAYDFSPSGVLKEVRRLLEAGRTEDALLLSQVNLNVNRYTTDSYLLQGEVHLTIDPENAVFPMGGAVAVWNALERRAEALEAWMAELHEKQPLPEKGQLEVELNHARAHVLRGEETLAEEIYTRILAVDPEHARALEGLQLLGRSPESDPEDRDPGDD